MNTPPDKRPLGELLVARGYLSHDQLRIALMEQQRSSAPLGKLLLSLGFVSEGVLRDALSENLGQESIELGQMIADPRALALVPQELARRHLLLPIAWDAHNSTLTLAMASPSNLVALDQVRQQLPTHCQLLTRLASESDLVTAIDQCYGYALSIDGILNEIETGEVDAGSLASNHEYSQPVVRLIDALMADAVTRGASDIHLEPEAGFVRIRYRIDGVLRQVRVLHKTYWPAMVVRVKVMANMNIAETRAPQDGRISRVLAGRSIDFRVAAQPTTWGENLVLRILDRKKGLLPIDALGLTAPNLATLRRMLARPEGLILVTGPTGSGKTTTLYSILAELSSEQVNIMTLEDPVEYPMPMIRQTSLNEVVKMDFASGIRSLLRQDPDVILIGEIRDKETADMAFRAAMTGHQVYATLHTNSAIGALPRLADIGVRADVMAGNIIGIVAQRLVRRLCPQCREPHPADALSMRLLGQPDDAPAPTLYRARGCSACEQQGYRGRTSVIEILRLDAELDALIAAGASRRTLLDTATARGFAPLIDDACRLVLAGVTTLDEIARVVDLTERVP
ncbi:GspE/PulE family protein [Chitinolyticbacter meiyuanensis]|uniref:GspE/PulE family protein n=1 Tax=Chitinolyticbacter meiyuanensis TaxID=682798 RepID=UPI0011E6025D|nr:GspE/PulE family protein [Chitinolyticbacter meiyuanensis]